MSDAPLHINTDSFRQGHGPKFLLFNFLYLCLLMGWTVTLPPLGRDYQWLETTPVHAGAGPVVLLRAMQSWLGGVAPAYHLTALLLLWLCMLLVFFLTRLATRGPWWLGSVAAVLFMAQPVKAEAALHLTGAALELAPAAAALAAMLVYALDRAKPEKNLRLAGLPLCCVLSVLFAGCAPLAFLPFLWERFIVPRPERNWRVPLLYGLMALPGLLLHLMAYMAVDFQHIVSAAAAAVFLAYPIGLLPETAARLAAHPVTAAALFACVLAAAVWFARRLAHPALSFGLCAAAVSGLAVFHRHLGGFDPVTLEGGGRLTLAAAFFGIAAAGLFHRMAHNPRWRRTAVWSSAGLCVLFMLLHGVVNLSWLTAGRMVREFQQNAHALAVEHPDSNFALAPDIGRAGRAPLEFAESVRYDTPFSRRLPVTVVAVCDIESLAARVRVTHYDGKRVAFEVLQPYPPRPGKDSEATLETPTPRPPRTRLLELRPRIFYAPERAWSLTYTPFRADFPEIRLVLPLERPAEISE